MALTTPQRISIGRLSTLYTSNELQNGQKHGGTLDKRWPHLLFLVTEALEMLYDLDPTHDDLQPIGHYLIAISKHQFKAEAVLQLNNGGTVAPITTNVPPNDIDFIVSDTTLIATGETFVYLDGTDGNPDLRGYNIDFFRSGQPQYVTPQPGGAIYYSWNNVTGLFRLLPTSGGQATEGEPFRISPKTGGGSVAVNPTDIFPIVLTGADFEPDGVTYNNPDIVGEELTIFVAGYNSEWQYAPTFFSYTATGIEIIASAFDANNYTHIRIDRYTPL
jgi:hypothetical protein